MKKISIITILALSIFSTSFSYGLYQVNSFSNQSFPGPELSLAA